MCMVPNIDRKNGLFLSASSMVDRYSSIALFGPSRRCFEDLSAQIDVDSILTVVKPSRSAVHFWPAPGHLSIEIIILTGF